MNARGGVFPDRGGGYDRPSPSAAPGVDGSFGQRLALVGWVVSSGAGGSRRRARERGPARAAIGPARAGRCSPRCAPSSAARRPIAELPAPRSLRGADGSEPRRGESRYRSRPTVPGFKKSPAPPTNAEPTTLRAIAGATRPSVGSRSLARRYAAAALDFADARAMCSRRRLAARGKDAARSAAGAQPDATSAAASEPPQAASAATGAHAHAAESATARTRIRTIRRPARTRSARFSDGRARTSARFVGWRARERARGGVRRRPAHSGSAATGPAAAGAGASAPAGGAVVSEDVRTALRAEASGAGATAAVAPSSRRQSPQPASTLEEIALVWFTRIGAAILLLGVAYFFKYAVDNNWIGPLGRVALGALAGAARPRLRRSHPPAHPRRSTSRCSRRRPLAAPLHRLRQHAFYHLVARAGRLRRRSSSSRCSAARSPSTTAARPSSSSRSPPRSPRRCCSRRARIAPSRSSATSWSSPRSRTPRRCACSSAGRCGSASSARRRSSPAGTASSSTCTRRPSTRTSTLPHRRARRRLLRARQPRGAARRRRRVLRRVAGRLPRARRALAKLWPLAMLVAAALLAHVGFAALLYDHPLVLGARARRARRASSLLFGREKRSELLLAAARRLVRRAGRDGARRASAHQPVGDAGAARAVGRRSTSRASCAGSSPAARSRPAPTTLVLVGGVGLRASPCSRGAARRIRIRSASRWCMVALSLGYGALGVVADAAVVAGGAIGLTLRVPARAHAAVGRARPAIRRGRRAGGPRSTSARDRAGSCSSSARRRRRCACSSSPPPASASRSSPSRTPTRAGLLRARLLAAVGARRSRARRALLRARRRRSRAPRRPCCSARRSGCSPPPSR